MSRRWRWIRGGGSDHATLVVKGPTLGARNGAIPWLALQVLLSYGVKGSPKNASNFSSIRTHDVPLAAGGVVLP